MEKNALRELVIDTSVIVKWFFEEKNTELALRVRESYVKGDIELYSPDLIIYELANVFRYGKIEESLAKEFLQDFYDMQITLIQPNQNLINNTLTFALNHDITIYDSIYLILAKELGIKAISADNKLYKKTESTDLIILLEDFKV